MRTVSADAGVVLVLPVLVVAFISDDEQSDRPVIARDMPNDTAAARAAFANPVTDVWRFPMSGTEPRGTSRVAGFDADEGRRFATVVSRSAVRAPRGSFSGRP